MVGGISAVNPYVGQYAGYVRARAAMHGSGGAGAGSQSTYGQAVQGVSGPDAVQAVTGGRSGRWSGQGTGTTDAAGAVSGVGGTGTASAVAGARAGQRVGVISGVLAGQRIGAVAAGRGANPGAPVEPVDPVSSVKADKTNGVAYSIPFLRKGMDPAELAVRMRIQYVDPSGAGTGKNGVSGGVGMPGEAGLPGAGNGAAAGEIRMPGEAGLPGTGNGAASGGVELPGTGNGAAAGEIRMPGEAGLPGTGNGAASGGVELPGSKADSGIDGAQKVMEEGECQTCKERKYQDGSDDAGVSYKTPTHISPDQAASAVKGHEMEHVVRERAAAEREDRHVVSQSVTMHTSICPECGRVYVSGGTTRTTTAANPQQEQPETDQQAEKAVSAVA